MAKTKTGRRRGSDLDDAILASAWSELLENGYASFTMEGVAKRAGTSRPVLSRRWQNRGELAVAALGHYIQQHPITVSDLGNVRDELAQLMQKVSDRGARTVNDVIFGLRDYFEETKSTLAELRGKLRNSNALEEILQRAVQRGEIDPHKLTKRIAALPMTLLRHDTYMTNRPVSRAVIMEMIDTIFLPLVMVEKRSRSHR